MAKLRPPPKRPADDESVEVNIEESVNTQRAESRPPRESDDIKGTDTSVVPAAESTVEPGDEVDVHVDEHEEENSLKKQLEELRASESRTQEQLRQERIARQQAEQLAQQHAQQAQRSQTDVEQAQYDWVLSTIAAAQSESETAQAAYEQALATGDYRGASESQKRMSRAEARLMQLEDAKGNFETARQQRVNAPVQQQPQQSQSSDPIDQMTQLSNAERNWLKSNREAINDPTNQEILKGAYHETVKRGIRRDSPEYFRFLENRLGLRSGEKNQQGEREDSYDADLGRGDIATMPVSRQSAGVANKSQSGGRVTLNASQREAAWLSMPDVPKAEAEREYARQLVRYQREKAEGKHG